MSEPMTADDLAAIRARVEASRNPWYAQDVPALLAEVERLRAEVEPIDPGLLRKWLAASDAARASEHHFPADCLAEAIDTVQHIATRAEAAERELVALRDAMEGLAAEGEAWGHGLAVELSKRLRAALAATPSETEEGR